MPSMLEHTLLVIPFTDGHEGSSQIYATKNSDAINMLVLTSPCALIL